MLHDDIDRLLRENGMHPADFDIEKELEAFKTDFARGLKEDGDESLMMLPSFLHVGDAIEAERPIIAVDAGGTHLRVALVRFDESGEMLLDSFENYPMPGTGGPISKELFYQTLAEYILPVADKSDTVGFCFSYPFVSLHGGDGEALPLCKEVEVKGIEGTRIGEETERALKALGAKGSRRYALLNDTVAAMLAGVLTSKEHSYDGYVGLILGTGLNACCAVDAAAITKADLEGFAHDKMIVNMEIGNYSGFPRGTVDIALDEASAMPGGHQFEKMISGAYMGNIILATLKLACREGLFSQGFRERTLALDALSLKDVNLFMSGVVEENPLAELPEDENDVSGVGYIVGLLFSRAAQMLTVALCGILECCDIGASPERPACVCAEGTTFQKSEVFREILDMYVKEYIGGERSRWLEFVKVENATLAGAAVAGMLESDDG